MDSERIRRKFQWWTVQFWEVTRYFTDGDTTEKEITVYEKINQKCRLMVLRIRFQKERFTIYELQKKGGGGQKLSDEENCQFLLLEVCLIDTHVWLLHPVGNSLLLIQHLLADLRIR